MPKKRTYKVFNKDGKKIFTGTSAEINALYNVRISSISTYALTGDIYKGKYSFEINDEAQQREVMPAWAKEWDEVRKKILAYG